MIRQLATAMLLGVFMVGTVQAEVERFEIKSREPFAGGKAFGPAGAYQKIMKLQNIEIQQNCLIIKYL